MNAASAILQPVSSDDLPEYPVPSSVRLDNHDFVAWEFRRYLESDMRWNGTHEIKSIWFELIQTAHNQTPVGTLPCDLSRLARMVQPPVDALTFETLVERKFGVLHGWRKCVCDDGQVRLMHDTVTRIVIEALSRKELNAARTDASSTEKRIVRLTETLASMAPSIAMEPAQVRFVDAHIREAMERDGNKRRTGEQLHAAIQACIERVRAGYFRKRE
ncbi:hypothetical protein [Pseudooceanicola atlanticus]|uniref:hypothetical protein n=1 Tax=Pseudooceanicola atlanticus TaxID=1461694 RepID=UPI00235490E3|nr:hypothetical protein [Pseudooceanicola atlanticus]